jgi:predicted DNA-binding transcriptional regulator AlpA
MRTAEIEVPRVSIPAEITPEYLRTTDLVKFFGLSGTNFKRLRLLNDDFPVPIRLSAKLALWNVREMRDWLTKQAKKSAAAPRDRSGLPVAPVASLRDAVDDAKRKHNQRQIDDLLDDTPPRRSGKTAARRTASAR